MDLSRLESSYLQKKLRCKTIGMELKLNVKESSILCLCPASWEKGLRFPSCGFEKIAKENVSALSS